MKRVAAWSVHAYTASGSVLALLMVHFAIQGWPTPVLWLFLAAIVIDGTDGLLARRFDVKRLAARVDGALLDNIVDYLTYVFAPVVLLWEGGYLPDGAAGGVLAAVPLLASCYQFTQVDAKTDATGSHHFLGFPSYWNVVAFYVVVLDLSAVATAAVVVAFAVLVFVPIKYIYPSRTTTLFRTNMALSALWIAAYAVITASLPDPSLPLVVASLGYIGYYVGLSVVLTIRGPAVDSAQGEAA